MDRAEEDLVIGKKQMTTVNVALRALNKRLLYPHQSLRVHGLKSRIFNTTKFV
jgi:hypothetical protein